MAPSEAVEGHDNARWLPARQQLLLDRRRSSSREPSDHPAGPQKALGGALCFDGVMDGNASEHHLPCSIGKVRNPAA